MVDTSIKMEVDASLGWDNVYESSYVLDGVISKDVSGPRTSSSVIKFVAMFHFKR